MKSLFAKRGFLIAIAALIAAIGFFVYLKFSKSVFRYAGTLEATRIEIPARVSTIITSIAVQEGADIEQGQRLIILDCQDIRLAANLAEDNYRRAVQLQRSGAMTDQSFDEIKSRKDDADARLSWCEISSPVTGTVLNRYLEPSEWVNPGTRILAVADLKEIWAYIYVPQEVMSKLKVGTQVTGYLPELGDRAFHGVVRKINEEAEFTPKNVQTQAERTRLVFGIKIYFENSHRDLKPGMTIEVPLNFE